MKGLRYYITEDGLSRIDQLGGVSTVEREFLVTVALAGVAGVYPHRFEETLKMIGRAEVIPDVRRAINRAKRSGYLTTQRHRMSPKILFSSTETGRLNIEDFDIVSKSLKSSVPDFPVDTIHTEYLYPSTIHSILELSD